MTVYQYDNKVETTLNGSINNSVTSLTLTSATGLTATTNFVIRIEDELILVGARSGTACSSCTRGFDGSSAASHADLSAITNPLSKAAFQGFIPTVHGCRVYHNTTQTLTNSTSTPIAFNSERFDTDAYHDTSTNNSRITIPAGLAGKYLIGCNIDWSTESGYHDIVLRLNGTTGLAAITATSVNKILPIETVYDLAAGDYIEAVVGNFSGSSRTVNSTANYSPEFWAVLLGT